MGKEPGGGRPQAMLSWCLAKGALFVLDENLPAVAEPFSARSTPRAGVTSPCPPHNCSAYVRARNCSIKERYECKGGETAWGTCPDLLLSRHASAWAVHPSAPHFPSPHLPYLPLAASVACWRKGQHFLLCPSPHLGSADLPESQCIFLRFSFYSSGNRMILGGRGS